MSIQSVLFVLVIFCIINDALSKPFGYEETDIVLPKFYNITITAREYDYDGQVEILTTFSNVTKTIKLNVYNTVTIETTKILHKYKGLWVRFPYQKHWTDPSEELYIIEFEYELMKNKEYKIIIDFSGIYSKYGFSMAVKSSVTPWIGTNLRRHGARRLFPCFDSKRLSSNFSLQLQYHQNFNSAAMTQKLYPEERIQSVNGFVKQVYRPTNLIAPYMLRFVIGNFIFESVSSVEFIYLNHMNIYPMHNESIFEYIAKETKEILNAINVYFKPKPINVQILIVESPLSFGFITLQYYPVAESFMRSLSLLKHKIGKELRYQLSLEICERHFYPYRSSPLCDGFAKFMEYSPLLLTRYNFTLAESEEVFLIDIQDAMLNEALLVQNENLPIGTNWKTVINQYHFDETKYDIIHKIMTIKRGAMFRMFEQVFSKFLMQIYLDEYLLADHGFNNLIQIAREKGIVPTHVGTIENIITQWDTIGFPVINLKTERITQHRFRYDGIIEFSKILIPISYALKLNFSENESLTKWFTSNTEEIKTNGWLLVNLHSHGYYKVNYNESHWMYLTKKLHENSTIMESVQRTKLIDDAFQLARAGKIKYDIPLNLSTYLINETSYGPWKAAINNFNFIESLLETESEFKLFTEYLDILMNKIYNNWYKLDSVKNTPIQRLFQRDINAIVCRFKMYDCVNIAKRLYDDWADTGMKLPQHLMSVIFCTFFRSQTYMHASYKKYLETFVYPTGNIKLAEHFMEPLGCFGQNVTKESYWLYLDRFSHSLHLISDYKNYFKAVFKFQRSTMNGRLFLLDIFRKLYSSSYDHELVKNLGKTVLHMTNECELEMFHYMIEYFSNKLPDKQRKYLDKVENRAKINIRELNGKKDSIIKWIKDNIDLLKKK